ncbi:hypothetical protein [Terrimonas ferruginea]|uniref:hypothetical protein n=1 Tax=Terrimonas ferruginea TaxID=249 RepID=UPI0004903043|nr:hypothetical protein [Terrimonas ferruginea]
MKKQTALPAGRFFCQAMPALPVVRRQHRALHHQISVSIPPDFLPLQLNGKLIRLRINVRATLFAFLFNNTTKK